MTTHKASSCPPPLASLNAIAAKLTFIAASVQRWADERAALLVADDHGVANSLTPEQHKRLCDLNSSLDTYTAFFEDLGELPTAPWIDRANATA